MTSTGRQGPWMPARSKQSMPDRTFDESLKRHMPDYQTFAQAPQAPPVEPIDPNNPVQTAHQRQLLHALDTGRIWGLAKEIWELAVRKTASRHDARLASMYRKLADDHGGSGFVFQLLCCHDVYVLRHLICNDLFSAVHQNPTLQQYVDDNMMRASPVPVVYIQGLCYPKTSNATHPGRFLSADAIEELLKFTRVYARVGVACSPDQNDDALDFDFHFIPRGNAKDQRIRNPTARRFCPSAETMSSFDTWSRRLRQIYLEGTPGFSSAVPQDKRTTPFRRVPVYVGITNSHSRRCAEHENSTATSPILGLVGTWTNFRMHSRFGSSFNGQTSFAVFPLWNDSIEFGNTAEALANVLLSASIDHSGYAIAAAGGSGPSIGLFPSNERRIFQTKPVSKLADVVRRMNSEATLAFHVFDNPFQTFKKNIVAREELVNALKAVRLESAQSLARKEQHEERIILLKRHLKHHAMIDWRSRLRAKHAPQLAEQVKALWTQNGSRAAGVIAADGMEAFERAWNTDGPSDTSLASVLDDTAPPPMTSLKFPLEDPPQGRAAGIISRELKLCIDFIRGIKL